jgi:hypothetical protein
VTIRDYLIKKTHRLFGWTISTFVLAVLCAMAGTVLDSKPLVAVSGLVFLACIPAWFCYHFRVRCPRCRGNIGRHTRHFGLQKTWLYDVVNVCPFCGVPLDQPLTPPSTSSTSPSPH